MEHTATGWWLREAGPVTPRPPLAGAAEADVVIAGGGYAGMWTAWHLLEREPGARVAILESGVCGHGPSGRNGGFVDSLRFAAPRLRKMAGDAGARATIAASLDSVRQIGEWAVAEGVDCAYHPSPQLMVSTAPAQDGAWEAIVGAHAALGDPGGCRELTAAEVRARCASPVFRGGALAQGSATVDPGRLALGLRDRLLARGAAVHEHSRVVALREGPDGVVARTAGGGTVRAGVAVLAIGGALAAVPGRRTALTLTSSHIVLTEPVPDVLERLGWAGAEPITDARVLIHYLRPTPDGRILFGWGGGRIAAGGRRHGRAEVDAAITERARLDLLRFFPMLEGRRVEHAWGGPIDASPNHLPAIRALGPRTWTVGGFTGNGVGPSHLCGRILARLARGARDGLTGLPMVDPAPARLPPEPLRWAGGTAIRAALDRKERAEEAGRRPGALDRTLAAVPDLIGVHIGR
ncbi:MAG: FAD-dependent oxidoreductase [Solirubrobacteraceae bacterium]